MNKLLLIYGFALFNSSPIVEQQESTVTVNQEQDKIETTRTLEDNLTALNISAEKTSTTLLYSTVKESFDIRDIEFLELEEEFDLGFDTSEYLPEGFNPYEANFEMTSVEFTDLEETIDLGFETSEYLPEGFNPYENIVDIKSINFMEIEDNDLGFDTADYLPEGFNPYEVYFDIIKISSSWFQCLHE